MTWPDIGRARLKNRAAAETIEKARDRFKNKDEIQPEGGWETTSLMDPPSKLIWAQLSEVIFQTFRTFSAFG